MALPMCSIFSHLFLTVQVVCTVIDLKKKQKVGISVAQSNYGATVRDQMSLVILTYQKAGLKHDQDSLPPQLNWVEAASGCLFAAPAIGPWEGLDILGGTITNMGGHATLYRNRVNVATKNWGGGVIPPPPPVPTALPGSSLIISITNSDQIAYPFQTFGLVRVINDSHNGVEAFPNSYLYLYLSLIFQIGIVCKINQVCSKIDPCGSNITEMKFHT